MKTVGFIAAALVVVAGAWPVAADSPLTSTDFHTVYSDVAMVGRASGAGVVDEEIAAFLTDPEVAVDLKAAVVNGLGWDLEGKDNADRFLALIGTGEGEGTPPLTPHQTFCLGYMLALDDYFDPKPAVAHLEAAAEQMPTSSTVALVLGLVRAQLAMDDDLCWAWHQVQDVLQRVAWGELQPDMRPEAEALIIDYMFLYAEYCTEDDEILAPEGMELD